MISFDSSNQTAWRKANLACKLSIDSMEKDELLHGGDTQSTRQRSVQSKQKEKSTFHISTTYIQLV